MHRILLKYLHKFCFVYIDDIVIFEHTTSEANNEIFDDDMATVHTADENPTFSLLITDKNIHAFNYSIIIKGGNDYKFFKENVKPDKQYGIYFTSEELEIITYRIFQ